MEEISGENGTKVILCGLE